MCRSSANYSVRLLELASTGSKEETDEISERGDVDTHELELGREVGVVHLARRVVSSLREIEGENVGHFDSGRNQSVSLHAEANQ